MNKRTILPVTAVLIVRALALIVTGLSTGLSWPWIAGLSSLSAAMVLSVLSRK